jgi:dienelactone hydrolase
VSPADVVEGDPIQLSVTGLRPGQALTLRASRSWSLYPAGEEPYVGAASFVADAQGNVDLRTSAPGPGSSYDRPDAAGLFWSMAAARRVASTGRPIQTLRSGEVLIEAESEGAIVARATLRMRANAAGVSAHEIREPGVTGVFARDGNRARLPTIIVLGGSEGGLFTARWAAPLLASHGYAVLGLAYFQGDEPDLADLPANLENIPLEALERAREWLARQPGVDVSRIAIVGVSKGAELALVAASTFSWVSAVGAFAPSHVVWEGIPPADNPDRAVGSSWTYRGSPLPFVRWSRTAEQRADRSRAATGSSRLTEVHLESLAEFASDIEAARIPVERSRAAMFIAAGLDDGMWPAAWSAEQLRARLARREPGLSSAFEIHPTGHQIMGTGWAPTTQFQRGSGRLHGGNARLDAEAQRAIWPAFLAFLDRHLRSSR